MTRPVHLAPQVGTAQVGDLVDVTGDEAHHAVAVRRLRAGESLILTDGLGTRAEVEVVSTGKRLLQVQVFSVARSERPRPGVTVVQALPKGDRGELAVEVLTEVGVERIVPWAAARSVAVWRGERSVRSRAKWEATAREAAKQARRDWFPVVDPLADTGTVLDLVRGADVAVVLHEEAAESALTALPLPESGDIVVVVGPEGGLTPEEVDGFVEAGATVVRLGSEVLRTSTAGVVAVGALLSRTGRWGAPSRRE